MTQTTLTLADFLLARIAEDEKVARNAAEYGAAKWGNEAQCWNFSPPERGHVRMTPDEARHIGRHDPARVLAECEAKRWIVETFRAIDYANYSDPEILRRIALPYGDHPDYRDEWGG